MTQFVTENMRWLHPVILHYLLHLCWCTDQSGQNNLGQKKTADPTRAAVLPIQKRTITALRELLVLILHQRGD